MISSEPLARAGFRLLLFLGLCGAAPWAFAGYALGFPPPATPVAHKLLEWHNLILLICTVVFALVFGIMFYSVFAHRRRPGREAAQFQGSTRLEIAWTAIPFAILVGMALPSTALLIEMDDTSRSDLTVKITGYRWKWKYDYPDQDIGFFSSLATPRDQIEGRAAKGEHYLLEVDNPLVIPAGKKVRFLITSNDVIHAWWVPPLGVKQDAIPGFINEMWVRVDEPGLYRGQCAELCGRDHGFMPIVVQAVSAEEFTRWVSLQKDRAAAESTGVVRSYSKEELMEKGGKVYATTCAACHGANGEGLGSSPKMAGSPIVNGPLAEHLNIVMHGKPGTARHAFAGQLSDADIAAVVTFTCNGFGNKTGDVVPPSQVRARRK